MELVLVLGHDRSHSRPGWVVAAARGTACMSAPWLLGIEIGGTKLQLGLGTANGAITALEERTIDPTQGAGAIRAQIEEAYRGLLAKQGIDRVAAAGIGFGGPVDSVRGTVLVSNQVEGWSDFPICEWLASSLQIDTVVLQNDSDSATLAEYRFGAGRGLSPLLYVNSGSGVGGGLVVNGQIYSGSGLGAIEIGHLWIEDELVPTKLEDLASGWAIARAGREAVRNRNLSGRFQADSALWELAQGTPERVTGEMVASAALAGDSEAQQIFARATRAMGRALAHATTLLAPRRIVLGGGVSQTPAALWLDPIRAELAQRVFASFRDHYDLVPAELGQKVVVHGALALAADAWSTHS